MDPEDHPKHTSEPEREREPEREPDYRMSLAAERTYLAYLRTGLALLAAGVAVAGALPDAGVQVFRRVVGVTLVVIGGAVIALGRYRWQSVDRAMRRGTTLPSPTSTMWLSWALIAVAGAAVVIAVVA